MNTLSEAMQAVAAACDHAQQQDGVGFNRFDSRLGHKLAQTPEVGWTPRQRRAAWVMLRKYRRQLAAIGIDYDAIPEPGVPPQTAAEKVVALENGGKHFIVRFPYNPGLVAAVRNLPGRRWVAAGKVNTVSASPEHFEAVLAFAERHGFEVDGPVLNYMAATLEARQERVEASQAMEAELTVQGLGGELRPFQKAGVVYALENRRCFIADEQGLGKTIQALATLQAADAFPAIVVCPASLKLNWQRETEKWLPGHTVSVWNGEAGEAADIVVINYDVLKKNLDALKALKAQAIVYDESHYCFPAGTMVSTDQGDMPIEEIVKNRLAISVASCDLLHNVLEYKEVTDWFEFSIYTSLVRITHERGEFVCTTDHPIWIEECGWTEAGKITGGSHLRMVPNAIPDTSKGQKHGSLLLSKLCCSSAVEVFGQTEDRDFERSRVVGVEILERGSDGRNGSGNFRDNRVYCLSIADNENFFADGILVSNCKNYKAARTEAAKELAQGVQIRLCLTGTPVLNRPQELLSQLGILGRLDDLGGFWPFAKHYCLPADAPILMGDLTEKPISEIRIGDSVIGWQRTGTGNRRLCQAEVKTILKRRSRLQRATLNDGTTLICTPDHRWLNGRGEHGDTDLEYSEARTGRIGGRGRGCASRIVRILDAPKPMFDNDDYKHGYLVGLFRGDGWCTRTWHERDEPFRESTRRYIKNHCVGAATIDIECIDRADEYLRHFGIETKRRMSDGLYRIEINNAEGYAFISQSNRESGAWWAGFLGGIYDAEGSGQVISQYLDHNPQTYAMIVEALDRFDFEYSKGKDNATIRMTGGRSSLLRFWSIANPSLRRKLVAYVFNGGGRFSMGGLDTMKTAPFVTSIEPLEGEHDVYTLTTETGNYVVYGCGSKNCNARQTRWGWDFSGAAHLDELNQKMRAMGAYIRREKATVLTELPPKQRAIVPLALSNRSEYRRAEKDTISFLGKRAAENEAFLASIADLSEEEQRQARRARAEDAEERAARAEQLVRIEALKRLSAQGKLAGVQEWIESFLETDEKLVVFAHHREIVEALAGQFSALAITGQTPIPERQAAVDRFQNDPDCRLIVLNIRAGGVGLTLTAASNVAFVELDWTPAAHDQAEDRCHRIGQQNAVTAWYLLALETIDQEIYSLIERKRAVVDAVTDGDEVEVQVGIMTELIEKMLQGRGWEKTVGQENMT